MNYLHSSKTTGKIYIFISAFFMGTMSLLIRYAASPALNTDVMTIVFYRSAISVILIFSLTSLKKEPVLGNNFKGLIFRGISGAAAMILSFWAISETYITNAMVLLYTFPMFATLIAFLLKRERPDKSAFLLLISFSGIFLIVKPAGTALNIGDIAGFLSGIFAGIAIFMVRELRHTDTPLNIAKYLALVSTLISFPAVLVKHELLPSPKALPVLVLIGFTATAGQYFMSAGYRYVSNSEGGTLSYSCVIFAAMGAFFIFGEVPDFLDIAGTVLIISSGAFLLNRD